MIPEINSYNVEAQKRIADAEERKAKAWERIAKVLEDQEERMRTYAR